MSHDYWTPPHSHDPNPSPPGDDPSLTLYVASQAVRLTPADLAILPQLVVPDCYIVSTGHGTSGPFTFAGVRIVDLISCYTKYNWEYVDVLSGDGFGTRLTCADLSNMGDRPAILALEVDRHLLTRDEGLVRLIVPQEKGDALQQVKWVSEIRVY